MLNTRSQSESTVQPSKRAGLGTTALPSSSLALQLNGLNHIYCPGIPITDFAAWLSSRASLVIPLPPSDQRRQCLLDCRAFLTRTPASARTVSAPCFLNGLTCAGARPPLHSSP